MPLEQAARTPLTIEKLREQLGRLGGSPFRLGQLDNFVEGEVVLPLSELNRLRRQAVERLIALRAQPKRWTIEWGVRSAECGVTARAAPDWNSPTALETPHSPLETPHSALRTPHFTVLV